MKIYDYNGKKNICGDRIHEARCRLRLTGLLGDFESLSVTGLAEAPDDFAVIESHLADV